MSAIIGKSKFGAPLLTVAMLGMLGLASSAYATPVTIQDGFVQAGVNDVGTLGSGDNTPPGILYDKTGTGNYGINDFLTPGTPFEGYSATWGGGSICVNNTTGWCFNNVTSSSPTLTSPTSATWTGTSTDGSLSIMNVYTLTTVSGQSVIAITTTLKNNTGSTMTGLEFLRTLDPDPDVNAFGSYYTDNKVLSDDQACGTGPNTGETICIYSFSSYTHKAGVSADWTTNPSDYLAGLNDGNGDYAIGVGFLLGDLGAGQSFTFDYGYALGASLGAASGGTSVPEPSGLAMFGLGALGLLGLVYFDASRRRRDAVRNG